tara:strand:+ start:1065 stop:1490 length:426 start_codon:yes stop_codon:yes gene_type:complete
MENIIRLLRRHEGVEPYAYKDHLGYITVGVGRCLEKDVGMGLSDDEIDYLLRNDIVRVQEELSEEYDWFADLDQVRQEAMINLSFNLGATRLRGFRNALAAMAEEDYETAANEFMDSKWSSQVGRRAYEVTQMIRTGENFA